MNRLICLSLLTVAVLSTLPTASDAGLFSKSKACHHHHPTCTTTACSSPAAALAPTGTCCATASICVSEPACHKHGCRPKHGRKAWKHARHTTSCLPVALACSPSSCSTSCYGALPYGYGIPADGPHWF